MHKVNVLPGSDCELYRKAVFQCCAEFAFLSAMLHTVDHLPYIHKAAAAPVPGSA